MPSAVKVWFAPPRRTVSMNQTALAIHRANQTVNESSEFRPTSVNEKSRGENSNGQRRQGETSMHSGEADAGEEEIGRASTPCWRVWGWGGWSRRCSQGGGRGDAHHTNFVHLEMLWTGIIWNNNALCHSFVARGRIKIWTQWSLRGPTAIPVAYEPFQPAAYEIAAREDKATCQIHTVEL